jgi:hypothetical protein
MTAEEIAEKYASYGLDVRELERDILRHAEIIVVEMRNDAPKMVFNHACRKFADEFSRSGTQATASDSSWFALSGALMACYPELADQEQ